MSKRASSVGSANHEFKENLIEDDEEGEISKKNLRKYSSKIL